MYSLQDLAKIWPRSRRANPEIKMCSKLITGSGIVFVGFELVAELLHASHVFSQRTLDFKQRDEVANHVGRSGSGEGSTRFGAFISLALIAPQCRATYNHGLTILDCYLLFPFFLPVLKCISVFIADVGIPEMSAITSRITWSSAFGSFMVGWVT